MSDLDRIYEEREARRAEQERQRREQREVAQRYLRQFYDADIAPSRTLAANGIAAEISDSRLVLHRRDAGVYADPLAVTVGEHGEIDVSGRSLGRFTREEAQRIKTELIGEILTYFDL